MLMLLLIRCKGDVNVTVQRVFKYYRVANIAWYAAALSARHLVVQRYIFAPVIAIVVVIITIIVISIDTNRAAFFV